MSLDKAIQHKKEYRKECFDSKAFDKTCRCHGSCEWCKDNRQYKHKKKQDSCDKKLKEYDDLF